MAGNQFFNNQNVYVETDYDNIIVVDPNKVVDKDGVVSERLVNHEELVFYASLEAKIIPRTKLVVGDNFQDAVQNIRVGKLEPDRATTINFMKPKTTNGQQVDDKDLYLNSDWTDSITAGQTSNGDVDSQMLGITNISVKVNASYAALVTIEMEDVQGRVMFEQGENSPYSAFFHLPYPLFTLTLKGYYGKAVRYELMLKDFNARFDPGSGNYKITTNYITRTYAMLSDITIDALFALPHMYPNKTTLGPNRTVTSPNLSNQPAETINSSRGFETLKKVYSSYKSKGLIPDDFPNITMNQMLMKLEKFDETIMTLFGQEDMRPMNDIQEYRNTLNDFQQAIFGLFENNWFSINIGGNGGRLIPQFPGDPVIYPMKKEKEGEESTGLQNVRDALSDLESLIDFYNKKLNSNATFGSDGVCKIDGEKIETSLSSNIKTSDITYKIDNPDVIDFDASYEAQNGSIGTEQEVIEFENNFLLTLGLGSQQADAKTLQIEERDKYFFRFGDLPTGTKYSRNSFLAKLQKLTKDFETKKEKVEKALTKFLTKRISQPDALGFYPNIKNVIAVISASADAFLRLMDDVHDNAWEQRQNPARVGAVMPPEKSEGTETTSVNALLNGLSTIGNQTNNPNVYPWPQYFVKVIDEDNHEEFQDRYPGSPSEVTKTQAYSSVIWPEVQFVEEYLRGSTQKDSAKLDDDFENTLKDNTSMGINAIEFPNEIRPYSDLNIVPFIYELFERSLLSSNYTKLSRKSSYRDEVYNVISNFEYNNLKETVINSPDLISTFKNFAFSYENYLRFMEGVSNNGQGINWNLFSRGEFTTPYMKSYMNNDYGIYDIDYLDDATTVEANVEDINKLEDYLKSNYSDELTFTDGYPFGDLNWIQKNLSDGSQISDVQISNDTSKMFFINKTKRTIASFDEEGSLYDRKPISYFEWIFNYSNSPTQVNSDVASSENSAGDTTYTTNESVINYYNLRTQKNLFLTESFVDYGTKYDTTKNFITKNQTTSLLNTPYFVNAIMKGVDNRRSDIEDPYVALGYLYLNSLPISTLREKFKTFIEESKITNSENYIFATLNKFSSIHKLPYLMILKYGSIWHRYKKYENDNIDILDGVWEDFDYKNAYDPNGSDTSKTYNILGFNSGTETIQQYSQVSQQITTNLGDPAFLEPVTETFTDTRVQNGFFPKVINDVYYFFTEKDAFTSYSDSEIQSAQTNKGLKIGNSTSGDFTKQRPLSHYSMRTWSQYFELHQNSDFPDTFRREKVLIVPSFGDVKFNQTQFECFDNLSRNTQNVTTNPSIYNGGVRSLWQSSNYGYYSNEMIDKPKTNEYLKYINPEDKNSQAFNLGNNTSEDGSFTYSSIEDIFGVFTKDMLDEFEKHFLNFCKPSDEFKNLVNRGNMSFDDYLESETVKELYPQGVPTDELFRLREYFNNQNMYDGLTLYKYGFNIREILKTLLIVDKPNKTEFNSVLKEITKSQSTQFTNQHKDLFTKRDVILKIGNPGKYNNKVYGSITNQPNQVIKDPYDFGNYVNGSLPTNGGSTLLGQSIGNYPEAWNAMYEYVGKFNESEFKYSDNGSLLTDFFVDMGYEFNESNVKLLAPLIKIYAQKKSNEQSSDYSQQFKNDLNNFVGEQENFQRDILNQVFIKLNRDLPSVAVTEESTRISKVQGDQIKLELWKSFQAMNDKWIAGQDLKTRTIYEDFLFMDRANRPVGDKVVVNVKALQGFIEGRNEKMSVYSLLGLIYQDTNFTFMPVPAYTNFYGRNERVKEGEPVPQDIPNDLFGTFMEVDVRDSRPRMLGIYAGPPSEKLDMKENKTFAHGNDSFDITNPSQSPLRESLENKKDYSDSNRCVGFQVDFGKRNQGVFNSVSIDMNQHKNIGPTFQVLADMGNQASGQRTSQQSQSLFNFYRTRSYTCQVQSLGNVMIQPTMYFNLTNVPMFYGPYLITNVSHSISSRGFSTNFEGTRIPKYALEPPKMDLAVINREILESYKKEIRQQETKGLTGQTNVNLATTPDRNLQKGNESDCQEITQYPQKDFVALAQTTVNSQTVIDYINGTTFSHPYIKKFMYGVAMRKESQRQNCFNFNLMDQTTDELSPNRDQFFSGQACVANGQTSVPIASFDNVNKCLDFMKATFNPFGGFIQEFFEWNSINNIGDDDTVLSETLAKLYMAKVYNIVKSSADNQLLTTSSGMDEYVENKINSDFTFKQNYETWLDIFKYVVKKTQI